MLRCSDMYLLFQNIISINQQINKPVQQQNSKPINQSIYKSSVFQFSTSTNQQFSKKATLCFPVSLTKKVYDFRINLIIRYLW